MKRVWLEALASQIIDDTAELVRLGEYERAKERLEEMMELISDDRVQKPASD